MALTAAATSTAFAADTKRKDAKKLLVEECSGEERVDVIQFNRQLRQPIIAIPHLHCHHVGNCCFPEFDRKFDGVRSIWRKHRDAIVDPNGHELDFSRKKRSGGKSKLSAARVQAALDAVPCRYRHSLRTLAEKTGIPTTTLYRHIKKMGAAALQSSQNSPDDAAAAAAGESPAKSEIQRQAQQNNAMELKLQNELKDYYEKEKTKMVEAAKKEARRQRNL